MAVDDDGAHIVRQPQQLRQVLARSAVKEEYVLVLLAAARAPRSAAEPWWPFRARRSASAVPLPHKVHRVHTDRTQCWGSFQRHDSLRRVLPAERAPRGR